jgi:ABC-type transporter Mla MlaB component
MAQKKKKAAAGARAPIGSAARASAQPRIAAPAAATTSIESAAAVTGAASVGGAGLLPLGSSLSIREVGERAAQFKALIASGSAEVDAGKLESIDTAGLQLLLAAAAAARRRGLTLRLHGAGSLNSGAANALGLADHLAATAEILP